MVTTCSLVVEYELTRPEDIKVMCLTIPDSSPAPSCPPFSSHLVHGRGRIFEDL